jgi:hypothetical protein
MTKMPSDNLGRPIQAIYPGKTQVVNVTAAHAETVDPFLSGTTAIRLACTVGCHFRLGTAAELTASPATVNDSWLPAGVVEYLNVSRGTLISLIREGAVSGVAWVTEGG